MLNKMKKINVASIVICGLAFSGAASATDYSPNPNKYGTTSGLSDTTPGTAVGDAAYARKMQVEYAKEALTNSTSAAEAAIRQQSLASDDCNNIKQSAEVAKKSYVTRHVAPDPTKVIGNSTCFADVLNIKIPSTGFGFADVIVGNLVKMVSSSSCNATNNYWGAISNAATTGDVKGLTNMAVTAGKGYVSQQIVSADQTSQSNQSSGSISNTASQTAASALTKQGASQSPASSVLNSISGWFSN